MRLPTIYLVFKTLDQHTEDLGTILWCRRELLRISLKRAWRRARGLDPDEIEL
jgi:hypothetical protein